MDTTSWSAFSHHAWLDYRFRSDPSPVQMTGQFDGVNHLVSITLEGHPEVRRISGGRERRWTEHAGTVHFLPADGRHHVFVNDASARYEFHAFFIPPRQLDECMAGESVLPPAEWCERVWRDDVVLQQCLRRLAGHAPGERATADREAADSRKESAARAIVRRIAVLSGGGTPEWHADDGVLSGRTLDDLVAAMDANLRVPPTLGHMAAEAGLSPGHFARKFRRSTGTSLHRFVNRRRIQASLAALKDDAVPLARVADDLGFSSQSHFTRLFSELTGMTPAKYRRQYRRTIG